MLRGLKSRFGVLTLSSLLVAVAMAGLAGPSAAATNAGCNNGAWQTVATPDGKVFKTQGDCLAFVAGGGTLVLVAGAGTAQTLCKGDGGTFTLRGVPPTVPRTSVLCSNMPGPAPNDPNIDFRINQLLTDCVQSANAVGSVVAAFGVGNFPKRDGVCAIA